MITDQNLTAGTTWEFSDSFDDYPSSEFDSKIVLRQSNNSPVEISGTDNADDGFDYEFSAEESSDLPRGSYNYQYIFTEKAETKKVYAPQEYSGVININVLLSSADDTRSDDEKVLDLLKDARIKVANREYVNINVNGKSTQFKTLEEIESAIIRYQKRLGIYKTPRLINSFG